MQSSADTEPDALIDSAALAAALDDPHLRVLDATFLLPPTPRDARAEFAACHIPGAQFFDIETISDHDSALPHMLPSTVEFERAVGALGIGSTHRLVLYDNGPLPGTAFAGAARVWWMFRVFGHREVAVLDGGLAKWRREARAVSAASTPAVPAAFHARLRPALVRDRDEVRAILGSREVQLVDARSAGRFNGIDPEPRPGLRRGNIPGALNLPFAKLLDAADGTLLARAQLRAAFAAAGVDVGAQVVASCGSGVTACVLALALHRLGNFEVAVYDGSWAEWGLS